jgi:hypothetical protein
MKNKSTFVFLTVLMSLLVIYALVANVILPVFTQNKLAVETTAAKNDDQKSSKKKKTTAPTKETVKDENIPDSLKMKSKSQARGKLYDLRKKEKFLQSKLSVAEEDSTYLVLDLTKKTASLELKGVSMRESKILDYKMSSTIRNQSQDALLNWISKPFFLKNDSASIPKISFIVKIAPKDSIEANQYETLPEPPKRGDVYVVMDFERNLRLIIHQSEKPDKDGQKRISSVRWNYTKDDFTRSLDALIHLNRELAIPTIEITLPKADATILYRALPYRPKLLLYL